MLKLNKIKSHKNENSLPACGCYSRGLYSTISPLSLSLTLSISLSLYAILFGFGLVSWVEIFKSKIYLIKYLTASLAAA